MDDDFIPDDDFEPDPQEKQGKIEPAENLLQRAMRFSNGFTKGFAGASTLGGTDLATMAAEKLVPLSPEAEAMNKKMFPSDPVAEFAGASLPIGKGAFDLAKFGVKGIGSLLRTSPLKEKAESLAFTGARTIKEKAPQMLDDAFSKFGKKFENLQSTATQENFNNAIMKSIQELGEDTVNIQGSAANKLYSMIENVGDIIDPKTFQAKSQAILKSLGGNIRARTIFYRNLLKELPDTIPGLIEAKQEVAPAYQLAQQAKPLTRGAMRRVAGVSQGSKSPKEEVAMLKSAEKAFGTDFINQLDDVGNRLEKVIRNQKIAKVLGGAGGLAGAFSIIDQMMKK